MNTHLSGSTRARCLGGLTGNPLLSAVLALALAYPALLAPAARADAKAESQKQFERAVKMRTMLEGYLEKDRSEADYRQTVLAYRKVYLITPTAPDATQALIAEAELYRSMGRLFDAKYFQNAIDRYNFLLKQYPGTRYRGESLFAVGVIQKDDLKKPDDARATFRQLLSRFPRSDKAADAQQTLNKMAVDSRQVSPASSNPGAPSDVSQKSVAAEAAPRPAEAAAAGTDTKARPRENRSVENVSDSQADLTGQAVEPRVGGRVSNVTRVQTWNSPASTRVIVTLNDTIKFESARIASPERIYFNLYKAKVGMKLSRQALDVNDGLLESVRVAQNKPDVVRLVLNVNGEKDYSAFLLAKPYRLVIDIHSRGVNTAKSSTVPGSTSSPGTVIAAAATAPPTLPAASPSGAAIPAAVADASKVAEKKSVAGLTSSTSEKPAAKSESAAADQPSVKMPPHSDQTPAQNPLKLAEKTVLPLSKKVGKTAALLPPPEPKPTRDGQRSLTRALGLKISRIVIDAGHGGHDTGTIGPHGLMEKDLCLDVALRLGALIEQKLPGAEVIYTRNDDTFIPLEERTALANRAQADLFISIHANSSHDGSARGVETYYLNFATTEESMEVASRENAFSQQSLHDLQDIIKKIARNDKVEESKELASDIQDSLTQRLQLVAHGERNRGVKKAPFVVLIGANMPSVLSEVSFVSNPYDEKLLRKGDQRQRIADGLFRGVNSYLESLNSLSNNKQKLVSVNPADPGTLASNGNPK
jgi:N-acetylmuramoyl-L-alanine amidase